MENAAKNMLVMLKNLQHMQLKLLQKSSSKTAEAMGDLFGNKIIYKFTKVSKSSLQNNLEIVESATEHKEIPKERYISPERRQQTIDDLRSSISKINLRLLMI